MSESVLVTTVWRVLGLTMEKQPPDMECSCDYNNKPSLTCDKGWSSNLRVWRGARQTGQGKTCVQGKAGRVSGRAGIDLLQYPAVNMLLPVYIVLPVEVTLFAGKECSTARRYYYVSGQCGCTVVCGLYWQTLILLLISRECYYSFR